MLTINFHFLDLGQVFNQNPVLKLLHQQPKGITNETRKHLPSSRILQPTH